MMCRECVEFLIDYLEGNLPDEQRARFEEHLRLCPPCVRYLDSYRDAVQLGRAAFESFEEDCGGEVPEALVRAVLSAMKGSGPTRGEAPGLGSAPMA
jgi:anti-sigma factor RsiW